MPGSQRGPDAIRQGVVFREMAPNPVKRTAFIERLLLAAAVVSASVTLLIFAFMILLALPLFREGLFFGLLSQPWLPDRGVFGVYPMILGTASIALLSMVIGFPLSLGVSALISTFAPGALGRLLKKSVQMMTAIPTVIYGFVGIFLLVPVVRRLFGGTSGMCILSAALMLAVLVAPTMILFFTDSFHRVPKKYTDAADALGATPADTRDSSCGRPPGRGRG